MEFFTTLATITLFGYFWIWAVATLVLIGGFILSEYNENGYPNLFYVIVYVGVFYVWGIENNSWFYEIFTWQHVLSYLGIGLVYAIIRTLLIGRDYKDQIKTMKGVRSHSSPDTIRMDTLQLESEGLDNLKDNVTRWWLSWPISIIYWLVSDAFRVVWNWVYGKFEGMFVWLFKLGLGSDSSIKKR